MQSRRLYSHPVDKSTGLQCDQTILLTGYYTARDYSEKFRRVGYYDLETDKRLRKLGIAFILIPAQPEQGINRDSLL